MQTLLRILTICMLITKPLTAFEAVLVGEKIYEPLANGETRLSYLGSDISHLRARDKAPDAIVFQAHLSPHTTIENALSALKTDVDIVHTTFPETQVVVVSPIPFPASSGYLKAALEARKYFQTVATSWENVNYVDLSKSIPWRNREGETFFNSEGTFLGDYGMKVWHAWVSPLLQGTVLVPSKETRHGIVFSDKNLFAAWPANGGSWIWGDEMLVCFICAPFLEKSGHNLDLSGPQWYLCRRSFDGGLSWSNEPHPELNRCSSQERAKRVPKARDIAYTPFSGTNFKNPNLAVMMAGSSIWFSENRGRDWSAPAHINIKRPHADMSAWARTAYLPYDEKRCLFLMTESARDKKHGNVERGNVLAFETCDGGRTFQALGQVGDFLKERLGTDEVALRQPSSGIMASVVRRSDGVLVAARRSRLGERKWTDIFESKDEGKTWQFLSIAEEGGGTPPALVYLPKSDRLVVIYANRFPPYGIRARLSTDGGKTWGIPYVLRQDAREWDIGYNRAHQMQDGSIITFYYYTTRETPEQFIAYTRWDVEATLRRENAVCEK